MNTLATGSQGNRRFEIRCPDDTTEKGRRGPVWSLFLYQDNLGVESVHHGYFVDLYQQATKFLRPTYNHSYLLYFSVSGSDHPEGEDVTREMLRAAALKRIKDLDEDPRTPGWKEAVGDPTDSYEEQ